MCESRFETTAGQTVTVDLPTESSEFFREIFAPGSGREGISADGSVVAAPDVLPQMILNVAERVQRQEELEEYIAAVGATAVQHA